MGCKGKLRVEHGVTLGFWGLDMRLIFIVLFLVLASFSWAGEGPRFSRNAVTAVCPIATQVGADILAKGGSAVDASVAVAMAMAVTWPEAGNIGGGGFMLIHREDRPAEVVEYRECAPLVTNPNYFRKGDSPNTAKAVGVPGTVAGLFLAHKRHGVLPWNQLVEPARQLASQGFPVYKGLAGSLNRVLGNYPKKKYPDLHRFFGPPDSSADWKVGMVLKQTELARTLEAIRDKGHDGFYKGPVATELVVYLAKNGGGISLEDLERYRAQVRAPLRGAYRANTILVPGPPSAGGMILLQMLGTLDAANIGQNSRNSPKTIQILTEASRFAFRDRARFAGDPDFQLIPSFLWEKDRVQELVRMIRKDRFLAEEELGSALPLRPLMPLESENTTHFSVMDENGMAVANTYTLEDSYGSHQVCPGGFLLNNEMGDFNWFPGQTDPSGKVGTPPNLIAPGKRMLSSQTPVIVLKENRAWIVSGSPGGRTIPNTVTQTILNIMEFQMGAQDGVDYPRVHHQWMPEILRAEISDGMWDDSISQLGKMGMKISRSRQGDAHTLVRNPGQKTIEAGIDHRIEGAAAGN